MITETYSPTFLASRTLPIEGFALARQIGWVRAQATELMKSVVKTPMSGGKVDYDSVPNGASIWVTVKDESSPMHGRPILITKRPDGQFALEGGSGVSHWHDDPEREGKIAARRHLVMKTPSPQKAQEEKAQAKDGAKVAAKNEERSTARKVRQEAAAGTRQAVGITDDPRLDRKARDTIADTAKERLQAHGLSPEEADAAAKHVPGAVQEARSRVVAHAVSQRIDSAHNPTGGRLARTDDHQPAPDQVTPGHTARGSDLPSHEASGVAVSHAAVADAVKRAKLAKGGDLSQPEMEQTVKEAVHSQVDRALAPPAGGPEQSKGSLGVYGDFEYFSQDGQIFRAPTANPIDSNGFRSGGRWEGSEKHRQQVLDQAERAFGPPQDSAAPSPPVGDLPIADVPEWKPNKPEEAQAAVQAFQREAEARGMKTGDVTPDDVANGGQQAVPGRAIDRSLADAEGLSDTAYDTLMDQYRQASKAPVAGAFYRALGEHWSSPHDYAASLAGHVGRGAATAIQHQIGKTDIDVADLVDRLGVDAAAHVMAAHTIATRGGDAGSLDTLIGGMNKTGGQGIRAIEQDALNRHAALQAEAGKLTGSLDALGGEGAGTAARRSELQLALARNIDHQRATLGGALGRMQMQATYTHALERYAKAAKAGTGSVGVPVALTFGDDERAADEAALAMRLPQGAYQKLHDARHGWTLQVDGTRMKATAEAAVARGQDLGRARTTAQDESPAEDYRVPGQATQIPDGHGGHASVAWTPMQRNDVEFLHKQAGGVLMGRRAGGKRLAALGWLAKQAADNPRHKAIVSTDAGGAQQWAGLAAQRFPGMRLHTVSHLADSADVAKAIKDFAASPGGVLVLPHDLVSARHTNQIARLADQGQIHAHVLENPPSGGTGRAYALGQEGHDIAQATAGSDVRRVALHDKHPLEAPELAAQLANWAHPDKVSAADLRKARDAGSELNEPTAANDSAIQRQVLDGLAGSVVAAPAERAGAGAVPAQQVRQQIAKQERQVAHPPKGETPERVEWRGELERAIGEGNDGEAHAILGMAHHYGWEPGEARALYQQLTGEGDTDSQSDATERESIENSPYFSVFHHFNKDSRLKKVNPYTGQRLLGQDKKTGKLGKSTEEPWEMKGSGYDQVAAEALSSHEGGHSQRYGQDAGDFWREATKAHRRYNELLSRAAPGGPAAASQKAVAVGGGAEKRKQIRGIFARKPDKGADAAPPADRSASDRLLLDNGSHLATRPLAEHVAEAKANLARTKKDVAAERKHVGAAAVRGSSLSSKGSELGRKAQVASAQRDLDVLPDQHRRHVERAIGNGLFDHLPESVQKEYAHRREPLEAQGAQDRKSFGDHRYGIAPETPPPPPPPPVANVIAPPAVTAPAPPPGKANTPVGMLPGTPKLGVGGASYTPIVAQPEDLAAGNIVKGNQARAAEPYTQSLADYMAANKGKGKSDYDLQEEHYRSASRAVSEGKNVPSSTLMSYPNLSGQINGARSINETPPSRQAAADPFKLQMQYGGMSQAQVGQTKQRDAGQQGFDTPDQPKKSRRFETRDDDPRTVAEATTKIDAAMADLRAHENSSLGESETPKEAFQKRKVHEEVTRQKNTEIQRLMEVRRGLRGKGAAYPATPNPTLNIAGARQHLGDKVAPPVETAQQATDRAASETARSGRFAARLAAAKAGVPLDQLPSIEAPSPTAAAKAVKPSERRKIEFDSPHRMTKDDWVNYRLASDRKNGIEPDRAKHEAAHRDFAEKAVAQGEDFHSKTKGDYPDIDEYQQLKGEGADRVRAIRKHEGETPNLRDFGDGPDRFDKYDEAIKKHREEHGKMVADQEKRVARRNELREQIAGKHLRKSIRVPLIIWGHRG